MAMSFGPLLRQAMITTVAIPSLTAVTTPVNPPENLDHEIVKRISDGGAAALKNDAAQSRRPVTAAQQNGASMGIASTVIEASSVLSERFGRLVHQWKTQRNPTMMASRMVAHPAYRAIIRMGQDAIPLVLQEMRREPDEWFYALAKMSGENPITDAQRGRFDQMVSAWLKWGRDNGYTR